MDLVGLQCEQQFQKNVFTTSYCCLIFFSLFSPNFLSHLLKAEMKRFATVDTSVLKQHYEKKVHELELEKKALQVRNMLYLLALKVYS